MLARTQLKEIIYQLDHSTGYGIKILEQSGKKIRKMSQ
jgi:hypothetical protein